MSIRHILIGCILLFADLQIAISTAEQSLHDPSLPLPLSSHALGQHRISRETETDLLKRGRRSNEGGMSLRGHSKGERNLLRAEMIPLYPGYGTHYSYVYVGTPAQRQSVIIDTGSEYTAFPCSGCSKCGDHTDSYWDPKNSSTMSKPTCPETAPKKNKELPSDSDFGLGGRRSLAGAGAGTNCIVAQGYVEGSSWSAFEVTDKLWVGSTGADSIAESKDYAVDFLFGCQTAVTGMFRDQLANGIMGMSRSAKTLPNQLVQQKVMENTIFALCYRIGGGIMTLGGVDQRIHKQGGIKWMQLRNDTSLYGLDLVDIKMYPRLGASANMTANSLGVPAWSYKGTKQGSAIVDSGTTDTYLPKKIEKQFAELFKKYTGFDFPNKDIKLNAKQLGSIPDLGFVFTNTDGQKEEVRMPWENYVDSVGVNEYAFRLYTTESDGSVLGANFMRGQNVIFDDKNRKVGFAQSDCNSEAFITQKAPPKPIDVPDPFTPPSNDGECRINFDSECSAVCKLNRSAYTATGTQMQSNSCDENSIYNVPCSESCSFSTIVRGDPQCPDQPWTDCSHGCIVSRQYVPSTEPMMITVGKGQNKVQKCNYKTQTNTCYSGQCPYKDGDYLIYVDLRTRMSSQKWSYVYTEAFYTAFARLFNVKSTSMEILNDAGTGLSFGLVTKLHFQLRLKSGDYLPGLYSSSGSTKRDNERYRASPKTNLHDAAESIVSNIRSSEFPGRLILALDMVSKGLDTNSSRFGWMYAQDIEVVSAFALPIGTNRDYKPDGEVTGYHGDDESSDGVPVRLIVIGVSLGLAVMLGVVFYLRRKLQTEHELLEKDKGSLKEMWKKFNETTAKAAKVAKSALTSDGAGSQMNKEQYEIELSKLSLMGGVDDDTLDTQDFNS
jgi:hypothetical protein